MTWHGKLASQVEKIVLNGLQQVINLCQTLCLLSLWGSRLCRLNLGPKHAKYAVEFVHVAHGLESLVVFGKPASIGKPRVTVIPGASNNAC